MTADAWLTLAVLVLTFGVLAFDHGPRGVDGALQPHWQRQEIAPGSTRHWYAWHQVEGVPTRGNQPRLQAGLRAQEGDPALRVGAAELLENHAADGLIATMGIEQKKTGEAVGRG